MENQKLDPFLFYNDYKKWMIGLNYTNNIGFIESILPLLPTGKIELLTMAGQINQAL